ncbi:MAG: outer membrane beta-barrel protein [Saprospiraceae bacterium]|nr:outer membrane beta-barrel protein [Saprospiraceae bacterium]
MKTRNYNDRLEEIFAQKLNNDGIADDFWNLPSPEVWTAIEPYLPQQKKRKVLFWWFFSGTFLLLGFWWVLSGRHVWGNLQQANNQANSDKQQMVLMKDTTTDALQGFFEFPSNNSSLQPKNSAELGFTLKNLLSEQQEHVVAKPNSNDASTIVSRQSVRENTLETIVAKDALSVSEILLNPSQDTSYLLSAISANTKDTSLVRMESPRLQTLLIQHTNIPFLENKLPHAEVSTSSLEQVATQENPSRWMVEVSGGDFLRLNPPHLPGPSDLKLINNHTFFAGVQIARNWKENWNLGVGLYYASVRFDANYHFNFEYSKSGEQQTALGLVNEYAYKLPSLASTLDTRVLLVRDAQQNIQEGSDIPIEMNLSHSLTYVSIPTYLAYEFNTPTRWKPYLKTGLWSHLLVGTLETVHTSTVSHHEQVTHHSSSVMNEDNEQTITPRRIALDGLLALGLKYYLTKTNIIFLQNLL